MALYFKSREEMIKAIKIMERRKRGVPETKDFRVCQVQQILEYFGTWAKALEAADVEMPAEIKDERAKKERLVRTIDRKVYLSECFPKLEEIDEDVCFEILNIFGTWDNFLREGNLLYSADKDQHEGSITAQAKIKPSTEATTTEVGNIMNRVYGARKP